MSAAFPDWDPLQQDWLGPYWLSDPDGWPPPGTIPDPPEEG